MDNAGTLEGWNIGIFGVKEVMSGLFSHYSIIPTFHYSFVFRRIHGYSTSFR
jgi:hypothetical protein